jgi:hypothetical protein
MNGKSSIYPSWPSLSLKQFEVLCMPQYVPIKHTNKKLLKIESKKE